VPHDNYLKNYRSVLFYFRDAYKLKVQDIELLLFIYDLKWFTKTYIRENFSVSKIYVYARFHDLVNRNYAYVYQEKAHNRVRKYCIAQKGKLLVSRFYRILEGKEYLPR